MEYDEANQIGRQGELMVSRELSRLASAYGFRHLDDLLLEVHGRTAQLDHVIIDRHGVVVFETKAFREGALMKGRNLEPRWTVCYGTENHSILNPLRQNATHEDALREVLKEAASPLHADYVKSAVIFVHCRIDDLDLDTRDRARVLRLDQLEEYLRDRSSFAVNAGDLSPADIDVIERNLRVLNWRNDPHVEEAHSSRVRGRGPRQRMRRVDRLPVAIGPTASTQVYAAARARSSHWRRRLAVPGLAVALLSVLLAAALLLTVWRLATSGPTGTPTSPRSPALNGSPTDQPNRYVPRVDVAAAVSRLREADPAIYESVTDLYKPKVAVLDSGVVYTWTYLRKLAHNKVVVRTVSITLASDGRVLRVESSK